MIRKMIPRATLAHVVKGRIRIRITGIVKGREEYFETLRARMQEQFKPETVLIHPGAGSLIVMDRELDPDSILEYGKTQGLFELKEGKRPGEDLAYGHSRRYIKKLNSGIRKISGNRLDISSTFFFLLIFHAMREIIRGNLVLPSWFSALWFASTLYNRDILNSVDAAGHPHTDGHDGDTSE